MGLVSALLTLPLAPVRGAVWVADKLAAEADRQLDPEPWTREQLQLLADANARGEIDDDEYDRMEEDLLRSMRPVTRQLSREGGS